MISVGRAESCSLLFCVVRRAVRCSSVWLRSGRRQQRVHLLPRPPATSAKQGGRRQRILSQHLQSGRKPDLGASSRSENETEC
jgi:hypothetical protein